jgi:serine/threonine-protein kinase
MVTRDGVPKLTDMGLAKGLADPLTLAGMVVGTPGYISPEQVLDLDEIDHRVDIFGLGASLYFTVTGLPPFVGRTPTEIMKKSATEDPVDPRQFNPSLTSEFELVIRTALAKKAGDRYQTALAMADALSRFV